MFVPTGSSSSSATRSQTDRRRGHHTDRDPFSRRSVHHARDSHQVPVGECLAPPKPQHADRWNTDQRTEFANYSDDANTNAVPATHDLGTHRLNDADCVGSRVGALATTTQRPSPDRTFGPAPRVGPSTTIEEAARLHTGTSDEEPIGTNGLEAIVMMFGYGDHTGGWAILLMVMSMIAFWLLLASLVTRRPARFHTGPTVHTTPDQILAERFARGDVSPEEYSSRQAMLDGRRQA